MKKPAEAWITVVDIATGETHRTPTEQYDHDDGDSWAQAVDKLAAGPLFPEDASDPRFGAAEEMLGKLDISIGDRVRLHWMRDDGDEERTGTVTAVSGPMIIIDGKSADNVRSIDTIQKAADEEEADGESD